jgi:hypothetical protein
MDYLISKENNMELLAASVFIIMYIFGSLCALYALAFLIYLVAGDIIAQKIKIIKSRRK